MNRCIYYIKKLEKVKLYFHFAILRQLFAELCQSNYVNLQAKYTVETAVLGQHLVVNCNIC